MKVYAVIDTNVLVSALLAKRPDSAPVQILDRLFSRDFVPETIPTSSPETSSTSLPSRRLSLQTSC